MILKSENTVPLTTLPPGAEATVHALAGGAAFVGRLAALGFLPGVPVRVVQNCGRGPLIVTVRDTRVALGCGEAERVLVVTETDGRAR
jgi:ferrous iron transport protein A